MNLHQFFAQRRLNRPYSYLAQPYLGRPFASKTTRKMVILHHPIRISYSQVYPFIHYAPEILERFNVEIRCHSFDDLLSGKLGRLAEADIVLMQPWFTIEPSELQRAVDVIAKTAPDAELSFLDSYAHNDLRLVRYLPENLRFLLKKSLFKERELFCHAFRGDTNLRQYYGDLYGLDEQPLDFQVPEWILPKLRTSPNFFTSPHLMTAFGDGGPPDQSNRDLDVQTRLGYKGSPWYQGMRTDALSKIKAIDGLKLSPDGKVDLAEYMTEMQNSKICFSPFGYGELCWRDIEAIQTGAVMIKQDMSHLDVLPNLYEAEETYLPIKWDFSDLEEVVTRALADEELRRHLAETAYQRVAKYIDTAQFVDDMAFLFNAEQS